MTPEVLEQAAAAWHTTREVDAPAADERLGRHALLAQIERLESDLCLLFVAGWPRKGLAPSLSGRGGPCLLTFGELEQLRDELLGRVEDGRRALGERTRSEQTTRRRIEQMLLEPERHKWVRVGNEDIGELGCRHWHVRPRWGLLGMLMNWWRVRISSGCPLHGAA